LNLIEECGFEDTRLCRDAYSYLNEHFSVEESTITKKEAFIELLNVFRYKLVITRKIEEYSPEGLLEMSDQRLGHWVRQNAIKELENKDNVESVVLATSAILMLAKAAKNLGRSEIITELPESEFGSLYCLLRVCKRFPKTETNDAEQNNNNNNKIH